MGALTRMLDGVDPTIVDDIRHAAEHVPGVTQVLEAKARWLGHRLHADVGVRVDAAMAVAESDPVEERDPVVEGHGGAHHHAPEPFKVSCGLAEGLLEIVDTPAGERMRLTLSEAAPGLLSTVNIRRPGGTEHLPLAPAAGSNSMYESAVAPAEPHEFEADLSLTDGTRRMVLPFRMVEPPVHH